MTTDSLTAAAPFDAEPLSAAVATALDEARRRGAAAAEASASAEAGLSATVRLGEVETVEHNRDKGLGVTVYFPAGPGGDGLRKGSASTTDFSEAAVRATVQAACDIAGFTAPDPHAGLAERARLAPMPPPDLELYHPWALTPEHAIDLALECEGAARGADARISNSEGATVSSHAGYRTYGTSDGFLAGYPSSRHGLSCAVIARGAQGMQRDHWYTVARDPQWLEAAEAVGRRAAERTLARLDGRRLSTRRVPVLFAPDVATGLLGHFVAAVSGSSLYREASFLLDALGQRVFAEHVRVRERPHLPGALGSAPFDGEGVATGERELVEAGVLQGYVLDSYAGRRLGLPTTGNAGGVHNLCIEPRTLSVPALLREMGSGLLVTELMGQGVNIVTGDYSRGAAGFWVENGAIRHPVEEVTIAGNLRDMFAHLVAGGDDVDTRGNLRSGSLLVESMTVAGE